jgi:hypothetical protein
MRPPDFSYLNNQSEQGMKARQKRNARMYFLVGGFLFCFFFLGANFIEYDFLNFSWTQTQNFQDCQGRYYVKNPYCKDEQPRSLQYCANTIYGGSEGTFSGDEGYILKQLFILIRHGDRSSIHRLPNSYHSKQNTPRLIQPEALKYLPRLESFHIKKISKGAVNEMCLNESEIFQTQNEYYLHEPGTLTTSGYMLSYHK